MCLLIHRFVYVCFSVHVCDKHSDKTCGYCVLNCLYLNFMQVCSNGTRVFVQKGILQEFLSRLVERTKNMVIGDPNNEDTTVGATISPQQATIDLRYIDTARKEVVPNL